MKDLIIVGASGFGREVAWLTERINKKEKTWNLIGFLDDDEGLQGREINSYRVLGKIEDAKEYYDAYFVCAVGASSVRDKIIKRMQIACPSIRFATLIDPTVEMSDLVEIGEGSIICAHTILTVNIRIGKHVIINLDCTIGHDAILDDFVTLYPSVNISGMVKSGNRTEFGTGSQIIQGKTVTSDCIIGAGAVVVDDILESGTYVGVPAKRKK